MREALSFKDITHNFEYQLIFLYYAKASKIFIYISIPLNCLKTKNYCRIHVILNGVGKFRLKPINHYYSVDD